MICLRISSRDVDQVLLVLERQDHRLGTREVRGEDLALQATDRQDPTTQRDLAGHRHVLVDGNAGEGADHGQGHRDARGRTVLGDAAGRDVDVQRVLLERLALDAQLIGVRADPREAGSRRLAHDLAQLAGEDEVLLARHPGDLDRDDVAADLGHDQARCGAGLVLLLELAVLEARRAEVAR